MSATKPSHLPRHHKGVPEKPALLEQKFCPAPQDSGSWQPRHIIFLPQKIDIGWSSLYWFLTRIFLSLHHGDIFWHVLQPLGKNHSQWSMHRLLLHSWCFGYPSTGPWWSCSSGDFEPKKNAAYEKSAALSPCRGQPEIPFSSASWVALRGGMREWNHTWLWWGFISSFLTASLWFDSAPVFPKRLTTWWCDVVKIWRWIKSAHEKKELDRAPNCLAILGKSTYRLSEKILLKNVSDSWVGLAKRSKSQETCKCNHSIFPSDRFSELSEFKKKPLCFQFCGGHLNAKCDPETQFSRHPNGHKHGPGDRSYHGRRMSITGLPDRSPRGEKKRSIFLALHEIRVTLFFLVGGFNPIEKYKSKWGIFPEYWWTWNICETTKPPPSFAG